MRNFRPVLLALWLILAAFTAGVISKHGLGLLPIFFGDIAKVEWPGQFNLDFLTFLVLSASWVAWRSRWSAQSWLLAVIAFFAGGGFLLLYLVYLISKHGGAPDAVLLGDRAKRSDS